MSKYMKHCDEAGAKYFLTEKVRQWKGWTKEDLQAYMGSEEIRKKKDAEFESLKRSWVGPASR